MLDIMDKTAHKSICPNVLLKLLTHNDTNGLISWVIYQNKLLFHVFVVKKILMKKITYFTHRFWKKKWWQ